MVLLFSYIKRGAISMSEDDSICCSGHRLSGEVSGVLRFPLLLFSQLRQRWLRRPD